MSRLISILLILLIHGDLFAQQADFEFVESIPIETTLDNPDIRDAKEVWLEMINGAKKSLDIEQFYVSNQAGEPLEDVIVAIERAAGRGVQVRLIADARMYKTYPETIERLGKQKNIRTRIIDFGKLAGGIQHAKYFIVDGEQIFLGSQNFDWRALSQIHELGLRIAHKEAVAMYGDIFELDWKVAEYNNLAVADSLLKPMHYATPFVIAENETDSIVFTPTASPRGLIPDSLLWDELNIIRLLDDAKQELMLQFLAYSPLARGGGRYDVLDNAIRRAAARGVNIKMIVSDWEKGGSSEKPLKELATVPNIEVKFSVIPDLPDKYISFARVEHCKYIMVDGSEFWLGTSNAEKSYFYNCRNLGVVVRNTTLTSILRRVFMKSWDGPYTETVQPEKKYEKRKHGEE